MIVSSVVVLEALSNWMSVSSQRRAITVEIHLIGLSVEASTGIVVTIMSHASTQLIVLRTKSLELKGWTTNSEAIEDEIIDTGAASSQHRKW